MSEYNRHKFAMEWMHGGGRDPHGRSLDEEIKIGKEDWMERQRVAQGGRIGLQSGQLVQPGPGRQGYQDGTEAKNIKFWKSIGATQVKKIKAEILKLIGKDPWFIVNKKDLTTKFKANVDKVDRAIAELLGEGRDIKFYDIGEAFDFDQKIKDTYRKNYKIKSLSQMASEMTGKTGYSKEWRKIYAQLMRYRDALIRHGFIEIGDTQRIMESSGEYKGAARTAYNWTGYRQKQLELMKKHPNIDVSNIKIQREK